MRVSDLAKRLVAAPRLSARMALLRSHEFDASQLADEVRQICYSSWTTDPATAQRAAVAIRTLEDFSGDRTIAPIADWVEGIAAITRGRFDAAELSLKTAATRLARLGRRDEAAQAQVARLLALGMLGRFRDAMTVGKKALRSMLATGDRLAAGKIELNLSNVASRQSRHRRAEKHGLNAIELFAAAGEATWLAMAENSLANTYVELNEHQRAEEFFNRALESASSEKMLVTEAEIEASLGSLALIRGRFAEALRLLELSRRKYDELRMPHQSAIADLEIADIYLELNLLEWAVEIYQRVATFFKRLKLRTEEARTRLSLGRALARSGRQMARAGREFERSFSLFAIEGNASGQASVAVSQVELALSANDTASAELLERAKRSVTKARNERHTARYALLFGEALLAAGEPGRASRRLSRLVSAQFLPVDIRLEAQNAWGEATLELGDPDAAESHFREAIALAEDQRSFLAGSDFSASYLANRLKAFQNLVRLHLARSQIREAFTATERMRSRTLIDNVEGDKAEDKGTIRLRAEWRELRHRLNLLYKMSETAPADESSRLARRIAAAEADVARISRRVTSAALVRRRAEDRFFDFDLLVATLGDHSSLIEFFETDGVVSAFVVGDGEIRLVENLALLTDIDELLSDLHFQFGSRRYGSGAARHAAELGERTNRILAGLYLKLIEPVERHLGGDRLLVVPTGSLGQVPFAALFDGTRHLIERFEITYAPSAAFWLKQQAVPSRSLKTALLVGHADEAIPLVEDEIRSIEPMVARPKTLVGNDATVAAFGRLAPSADLIHLACHGRFRPDNPMFSSLHLADGWITVEDLVTERLRAGLVVLSACETALGTATAGDEIFGLTRGFFLAGASSLIVSLWAVNDAAVGQFMQDFYNNLQRSASVSASLQGSQQNAIARGETPYLWAAFISVGR